MSLLPLLLGLAESACNPGSGPACDACHKPLAGGYYTCDWGHRFCLAHRDQPRCDGCGLPIAGKVVAGFTLPLCATCAAGAALTAAEAACQLSRVQSELRGLGLPWWPQSFPTRVVPRAELIRLGGPGTSPDALGLARATFTSRPGASPARKMEEILVVPGLHPLRLGAVLAHELGHAWLWQQGFLELSPLVNEGFPELCAYRWLSNLKAAFATVQRRRMEQNEDPVYGGGFRMVLKVFTGEATLARAKDLVGKAARIA